MQCAPLGEVETGFLLFDTDGITGEEIGNKDQVAVAGDRVGQPERWSVTFKMYYQD